eukprot:g15309.t1
MEVGFVEGVLAPLRRVRDAIQGATDLKPNLRQRYGDYSSIMDALKRKPEAVAANEVGRELRRLTELFTRVAELLGEYTAAPADGSLTKGNIKAKRATDYKDVNEELDKIDREVMRQLAIMNLTGVISTSQSEILQIVDEKIDRLTSLVNDEGPPSLPERAAVPAGALALPSSYVERAAVQEVADGLTNPEKPRTPYTVVGMGGGGKSVLASAVVRRSSVREHFLGGLLELVDMTEEEARELLLKTSKAVGQPGDGVRTQMAKVTALCGHTPLVLAIAGSMPVVKGKGLTAVAWAKLIKDFDDVAEKIRARGEQSTSIKFVLETSLDALSRRRQKEFLKMGVLAAGAVAPVDMLRNLWEIEDTEGTKELQRLFGARRRMVEAFIDFILDKDNQLAGVQELVREAHFSEENLRTYAEDGTIPSAIWDALVLVTDKNNTVANARATHAHGNREPELSANNSTDDEEGDSDARDKQGRGTEDGDNDARVRPPFLVETSAVMQAGAHLAKSADFKPSRLRTLEATMKNTGGDMTSQASLGLQANAKAAAAAGRAPPVLPENALVVTHTGKRVSDFYDRRLFAGAYPNLFPHAVGGHMDDRRRREQCTRMDMCFRQQRTIQLERMIQTFYATEHPPVSILRAKSEQALQDSFSHRVVKEGGGDVVGSDELETLGVIGIGCLQPACNVQFHAGHLQHDRAVDVGRTKNLS